MSKKSSGGLQYVDDFSFPADQGFTGSAGRTEVKGYMRGGHVKRNTPNKTRKRAPGTTAAARGGSVHDKLVSHGKKMGYKTGGYAEAKNTSSQFRQKRGKMDSMDHGVQPARRGANARNQAEKEAGGTGRLKPGLKKGGAVKRRRPKASVVGALASAVKKVDRDKRKAVHAIKKATGKTKDVAYGKKKRSPDMSKGKGMSTRRMPKNVKARGGPVGKHGAAQ